ncbi:hypothetical protein DFH08DRAFT_711469, partial [Mycena albidolilacea]
LRLVREWHNLRALKRGGIGNDPDRFSTETRDGELAVECITCPKVGVNLPEGWHMVSPERRWVSLKKISSWAADPSIQDGWAYFTAWKEYGPFGNILGEQTEVRAPHLSCLFFEADDAGTDEYVETLTMGLTVK